MKTFSTSGTGSGQTLSEIESDKIPIYDSLTDVTADLANLSVGQIVATKDTGSELSAPVDTVQSGNMHAVTSNAVAESLKLSDIKITTISDNSATPTIINNSGFLIIIGKITGNADCYLTVNNKKVCTATIHNDYSNVPFSFIFPVAKGDSVYMTYNSSFVTIDGIFIREFNFN